MARPGLPDTHDGLFHFFRVMALGDAVAEGCGFPRWLPQFAFGYGQPVFAFYGAAAYYQALSAMLVGLDAEAALKLSWYLGFAVSGAGAYGLARRRIGPAGAALAGAAYVLFPYRLANVYVRGAFAEHWGLALLPLVLLAGERAVSRGDRRAWATLVLLWAALIFTHHLSAFLAAPLLIAYLAAAGWGSRRRLLATLSAIPAGGLLTAFYWLPMLTEVRLVGLGQTFSTDAWARFLAPLGDTVSKSLVYRYYPQQGVAHEYPLGLVSAVLLLAGLAILLVRRPRESGARRLLAVWVAVLAACWGLQWTASAPVWETVPLLGFLQFPWRLMGPFALASSMILGEALDSIARRWPRRFVVATAAIATVALMAASALWALPRASVAVAAESWVQDMWDHDAAIGQVGATWTAEYVPVWVTVDRSAMPWDAVDSDRPPVAALPAGAELSVTAAGSRSLRVQADLPESTRLTWHSFYYPGQQVTVGGEPVDTEPYTDLGLASAEIAAGSHEVRWRVGETMWAWLGRVGTGLAIALLAVALCGGRRRLVVGGLALGLALGAMGCTGSESAVNPTWLPFEDDLALGGWRSDGQVQPGEPLALDLYWVARRTPRESYKVFVHLQSPSGEVVAQSDGDPVGGYTRSTRMVAGQITGERRLLAVPEHAPPGQYALYAGLYRWPEVSNLVVAEGEQAGAERALLGYVEVLP